MHVEADQDDVDGQLAFMPPSSTGYTQRATLSLYRVLSVSLHKPSVTKQIRRWATALIVALVVALALLALSPSKSSHPIGTLGKPGTFLHSRVPARRTNESVHEPVINSVESSEGCRFAHPGCFRTDLEELYYWDCALEFALFVSHNWHFSIPLTARCSMFS